MAAAHVTERDLIAGLADLGVGSGDLVLAHISMGKLGHVEGGAEGLIGALLRTVGDTGTLALPGFSFHLVDVPEPVFDVLRTPTWASKVYERFRSWPGVRRSHHATHSVCAVGPRAEELTVDHGPDPCGVRSPFARLARWGGRILLMGVSHNSSTTFHAVEEQEKLFYCRLREAPGATIVDEEGRQRPLPTRLHSMSRTYDFNRANELLLERGIQREALIGEAIVRCLNAEAMFGAAVALVRADPSALLMQDDQRHEIPVCRQDLEG
jgi:aminoglycoside 3-N-acetyltransferase